MSRTVVRTSRGTLDAGRRQWVRADGSSVQLAPLECELLAYLAARPGRSITRAELLTEVWGYAPGVTSRAVDHTVRRLRTKLDPDVDHDQSLLRSVYGGGYRLDGVLADVEARPRDTALVGRAQERARLEGRIGEPGVIGLVGPGGVGKTSLAREVVHGKDVCWVDLHRARQPGQLVVDVAMALGLTLVGEAEQNRASIGRALAGRKRHLVVFDNTEQLEPEAIALLHRWLAGAPEATVLYTSRVPLGLAGERIEVLETLDRNDALALLGRLAHAVAPGLDPEGSPDRWLPVVDAVDRLPLALVLLAPRLGLVEPEGLVERLAGSLQLLAGPGTGRHTALERSLRWSWELLDEPTRDGLVSLARIPTAFDLRQAEAVIGGEAALATFETIRAGNWLERRHDGRVGLYASVRTFVASVGAAAVADAAETRRRAFLLDRLPDASTAWFLDHLPDLELAVLRALPEEPNAAAALAHGVYRVRSALPTDRLLALLRAPLRHLDPDHPAHVELSLDVVSVVRRRRKVAGELAAGVRQLVRRARELVDVRLQVRALRTASHLAVLEGALDRARADLDEAVQVASEGGDPLTEATALEQLGLLESRRGRPEAALVLHQRAWALYRTHGRPDLPAAALANIGKTLRQLGRWEEAEEALRDALGAMEERLALNRALVRHNLGNVLLEREQLEEARHQLELAAEALEGLGAGARLGGTLLSLVAVDLLRGAVASAGAHARWAVRVLEGADPQQRGWARVMAAVAALREGDLDGAEAWLDEASPLLHGARATVCLPTLEGVRDVALALRTGQVHGGPGPLHALARVLATGGSADAIPDLHTDPMARALLPLAR